MKEIQMSQYDSSSTTVIREMREADTIHVHQIHTDCLTVSLKDHYSTAQLEAWMYGRSPEGYWRFANSGETFRVAERNGQIVGFANWQGDELRSLFISPAHQYAGIGSALFRSCDQESRVGFVKAALSAVPFYRRFSFVEAGRGFDMKRGIQLPHIAMRRPD
jgi:putative acetyltransferase